jgi:2'-5' RNA ligase
MSPLPKQLIDRWRDGHGAFEPEHGTLYWHVLMGGKPQLRDAALTAQTRISKFSGLHMTPPQWLHLTVLPAGPASQIQDDARNEMLTVARSSLSGIGPIEIEFNRVFYHPEAIVLRADPAEALNPIREAAERATQAVTGGSGTNARSSASWMPHVTLCYSTSRQRAEPIIAALGTELPRCRVSVDTLSLVVQQGAEWLWNWSPVGSVSLQDSLPTRLPGNRGTLRLIEAAKIVLVVPATQRPPPAV